MLVMDQSVFHYTRIFCLSWRLYICSVSCFSLPQFCIFALFQPTIHIYEMHMVVDEEGENVHVLDRQWEQIL